MNKKTTTLHEKKGVSQPETTSKLSAEKIKIKRNKHNSVDEFVSSILEGSIPFLSKAITLVESTNPRHQEKANEILERCLPHANNSIRIGITGVPGVGKTSFLNVQQFLLESGHADFGPKMQKYFEIDKIVHEYTSENAINSNPK